METEQTDRLTNWQCSKLDLAELSSVLSNCCPLHSKTMPADFPIPQGCFIYFITGVLTRWRRFRADTITSSPEYKIKPQPEHVCMRKCSTMCRFRLLTKHIASTNSTKFDSISIDPTMCLLYSSSCPVCSLFLSTFVSILNWVRKQPL